MEVILTLAIFAAILVIAVRAQPVVNKSDVWEQVREHFDFEHAYGGWSAEGGMKGEVNGVTFSIHTEKHGHEKHKNIVAVVQADLSSRVPAGLELRPRNILGKVGRALFRGDESTEDALYDAFHVEGDDDPAVRALVGDDEVREALLDAQRQFKDISIEDRYIFQEFATYQVGANAFAKRIRTAAKLARTLDQAAARLAKIAEQPDQQPRVEPVPDLAPSTGPKDEAVVFDDSEWDEDDLEQAEPEPVGVDSSGPSEPRPGGTGGDNSW